MSSILVEST